MLSVCELSVVMVMVQCLLAVVKNGMPCRPRPALLTGATTHPPYTPSGKCLEQTQPNTPGRNVDWDPLCSCVVMETMAKAAAPWGHQKGWRMHCHWRRRREPV